MAFSKKICVYLCTTLILGLSSKNVAAFGTSRVSLSRSIATKRAASPLFSSALPKEGPIIGYDNSCYIPKDECNAIIRLKKDTPKEKIVNAFGLYTIFVSLIVNPIWWLAMAATDAICKKFPDLDPHRSIYDATGKLWAKAWLTLSNSYPTVSGDVDRLKSDRDLGACLFVANHGSWLDIPVLCTILDPVFKFIAKGELKDVPCIGKQLVGGNHIMIDREDRRSQLRTFKEGVNWLKKGVPLMAFPEGMRSSDGRLMDFKGGLFSMAVKANVPIVPISISNTHAVMPSFCLFPVQDGSGKLHVHVHEPINTDGKSEAELAELVREKLLSRLPSEQQPLPKPLEDVEKDILATIPKTEEGKLENILQNTP